MKDNLKSSTQVIKTDTTRAYMASVRSARAARFHEKRTELLKGDVDMKAEE